MSNAEGVKALKDFLVANFGTVLRGWLKYFDADHDQRTTSLEFCRVLRSLNFNGDPAVLFAALDADDSGELCLDEIDEDQAQLWQRFRVWAGATFQSPKEMLDVLAAEPGAKPKPVTFEMFKVGVQKSGWDGGEEEILFASMDSDCEQQLSMENLKWLDVECKRLQRKAKAKLRAQMEQRTRNRDLAAAKTVLHKFKRYLRDHYGCYIRAWRTVISPDDRLMVSKSNFLKACSEIGFRSDSRLIWHALGKDECVSITLDEFEPRSAILLADFHKFVQQKFGSTTAAFQALDKANTRRLRQPEFEAGLHEMGYSEPLKGLFRGLDKESTNCLFEKDLYFLDGWRPPPFLLTPPNHKAKEEIKAKLVARYGSYLKAWRRAIDMDSSNQCDWKEFQEACKKVQYAGDVPGAWRALDDNLSGCITLREIDPVSSCFLEVFRKWAQVEFGSVKEAFGIFDADGSKELTCREFCRACRIFGFTGSARNLFFALDVEKNGTLSLKEVAFLDEWCDDESIELERQLEAKDKSMRREARARSKERVAAEKHQAQICPAYLKAQPRVITTPDRAWWPSLPVVPPDARRTPKTPRKSPAWCSICKSRTICTHMSQPQQQPPALLWQRQQTRSEMVRTPLTSREVHSPLPLTPTAVRPRSTPGRDQLASYDQRSPRRPMTVPVPPPSGPPRSPWGSPAPRRRWQVSPLAKLPEGTAGSDRGSSPSSLPRISQQDVALQYFATSRNLTDLSNAEVQLMALRLFPMGSVPPSMSPDGSTWLAAGWSMQSGVDQEESLYLNRSTAMQSAGDQDESLYRSTELLPA